MKDQDQELEIEYPTRWQYKVIGRSEVVLRAAVEEAVEGASHEVSFSNRSSKGKYLSLLLEVEVQDEAQRKSIWDRLSAHSGVLSLI